MKIKNYQGWYLRNASFVINGITCRLSRFPISDDIPLQIKLASKIDLCGYVSPDGEYYKCEHCEHENFVKTLICGNLYTDFINMHSHFYDSMPYGMLKEEYYLMKEKRFIKISSFREAVDEMYLLHYYPLTPEQIDLIYPR